MLVNSLNSVFWLSVCVTIICVLIVVFALGKFKRNRKVLIVCLLLPLFLWPVYMVKRRSVLNQCSAFLGKVELRSFYGKEGCQLEIKDDFYYEVKCDGEVIKEGEWDVPNGSRPKVCMLDKVSVLGQGEFEIKK